MGQKLSVLSEEGNQVILYLHEHISEKSFALLCKCFRIDKKRFLNIPYIGDNKLVNRPFFDYKRLIYQKLYSMAEKESEEGRRIQLSPEARLLYDEVTSAFDLLYNKTWYRKRFIKESDKPCPVCGKYMLSQFKDGYICPECHYLSTGYFTFEEPDEYTTVNPDSGLSFVQHKQKYEAQLKARRIKEKAEARIRAEKEAEEKRRRREEKRRRKIRERGCVRRGAGMFH